MAVDLAVMLADAGETITDLAVLRDQREVFGPVASTPTAWRLLADIGPPALAAPLGGVVVADPALVAEPAPGGEVVVGLDLVSRRRGPPA